VQTECPVDDVYVPEAHATHPLDKPSAPLFWPVRPWNRPTAQFTQWLLRLPGVEALPYLPVSHALQADRQLPAVVLKVP
jgi:hypothetical protein